MKASGSNSGQAAAELPTSQAGCDAVRLLVYMHVDRLDVVRHVYSPRPRHLELMKHTCWYKGATWALILPAPLANFIQSACVIVPFWQTRISSIIVPRPGPRVLPARGWVGHLFCGL